jgi:hypothetical protein
MILARKAVRDGDPVLAETFYQKAEHYVRLEAKEKEKSALMQTQQPILSYKKYSKINNLSVLKQSRKMRKPSDDFEMSIEQELEKAQSKRQSMVPRTGIEPVTHEFSVHGSTN